MTMTLGRVGVDIALADPKSWTRNGSQVTINGVSGLNVSTQADRITLSEQLLGLADNPDEPFVACTWSLETWFDGYYRVDGVTVDTNPRYDGYFPYSIQLTRVADGASPTIDVSLLGALRTNGNSVTSGRASTWGPGAMQGGTATVAGTATQFNSLGVQQTRTTETGTVISAQVTGASGVTNSFAAFDVSAADYYNGSCTIRSGTTLRRVMGARMKLLPTNWELSNGLIRITPAALSTLQMEIYASGAWEDARTFHFTNSTQTTNFLSDSSGWGDISVLRNSPEAVSIRIVPGYPGGSPKSGLVADITLQRGRYFCEIYYRLNNTSATQLGLARTTAEAATALTGGIRATSDDASGNRYILAMSQATTNDLTQGLVRNSSAVAGGATFMLGYELDGSGGGAPNTAQNLIDEWYYAMEERMAPRTR